MPRTTLDDRARKSRIREREHRKLIHQISQAENMSAEQKSTLQSILAGTARNEPVKVTAVANWRELRQMGVVREKDGVLMLTTLGTTAISD
jgi:hypothetical protein